MKNDDVKNRLDKAFDEGRLDEELRNLGSSMSSGEQDYAQQLLEMERILSEGTSDPVPVNFAKSVLRRLPGRKSTNAGMLTFLAKPVLIMAALVLSIVFSEPLGFSALLSEVEQMVSDQTGVSLSAVFYVCTTGGMLVMMMLIFSNTTSIRSRRVER